MFCVLTAFALWRMYHHVQKDIRTRKKLADKHVRDWRDRRNISVHMDRGLFGNYYSLRFND